GIPRYAIERLEAFRFRSIGPRPVLLIPGFSGALPIRRGIRYIRARIFVYGPLGDELSGPFPTWRQEELHILRKNPVATSNTRSSCNRKRRSVSTIPPASTRLPVSFCRLGTLRMSYGR